MNNTCECIWRSIHLVCKIPERSRDRCSSQAEGPQISLQNAQAVMSNQFFDLWSYKTEKRHQILYVLGARTSKLELQRRFFIVDSSVNYFLS